MTKTCINYRQRSRTSDGRDYESCTEAKAFLTNLVLRSFLCWYLFRHKLLPIVDICNEETFLLWNSCLTQLMIYYSKWTEVILNYPNF